MSHGTKTTYHNNGVIKCIMKDGALHEYDEDGQLSSIAKGKVVEYFHETGELYKVNHIDSRNQTKKVESYYKSGVQEGENRFKNGKLHGVSRYFYENSSLSTEEYWVKGELSLLKEFNENGMLLNERDYLNGIQVGKIRNYDTDGLLIP